MKRALIAIALVTVSSAAFAEAGRPLVQGKKCWAITDGRGFGYWDQCAGYVERAERNRAIGLRPNIPRAVSQLDLVDFDGAGGAAGDGGGGGGNGR